MRLVFALMGVAGFFFAVDIVIIGSVIGTLWLPVLLVLSMCMYAVAVFGILNRWGQS